MTVLAGMMILGKYIFVSKVELPTMLLLDSEKELEKNCHGSIAEYTNMG